MTWDKLSIRDRVPFIKLSVLKKVPLEKLKEIYNQLGDGGNITTPKRLDVLGLKNDPTYKKWYIDKLAIEQLLDSLIGRNAGLPQRIAVLSLVIPESGGRTKPHGNGAYGLIGWRGTRAINLPNTLDGQIHNLMEGLFNNPKGKDWTDGGKGTGVMTGKEMMNLYNTSNNTELATKAIMKGYVRPESSEYLTRIELANLLKRYMK